MTLAAAFAQLASWSVTGVTTNFAVSAFDGRLNDNELPALVPLLSGTGGDGFRLHSLGGSSVMVVHVQHYLITEGLGRGSYGVKQNDLIALVDNYLTQVEADPRLDGNLREPTLVELSGIGPIDFAGKRWYGLTFRHRWNVFV